MIDIGKYLLQQNSRYPARFNLKLAARTRLAVRPNRPFVSINPNGAESLTSRGVWENLNLHTTAFSSAYFDMMVYGTKCYHVYNFAKLFYSELHSDESYVKNNFFFSDDIVFWLFLAF